ncbi:MAG: aminopeptidase P family protein [Eubacteriales bacterium]|nr:aminopeptidase P family protein [Eubacteriales bacterium]
MTANERLQALRQVMREKKIDAYLVQSSDYHQSEYLAPHFAERAWLTGFTGSAGLAIVTADEALVWADGRYTIQAKQQLEGSDFKAMPWGSGPGMISPQEWLRDNLPDHSSFGYYGAYMSPAMFANWEQALKGKEIKFVESEDLVGAIWAERPAIPESQGFILGPEYSGKAAHEKLAELRSELKAKGASHTVLASLDDIAWLFNLRGRDIESNPVLFAYAMITPETATLYTSERKLSEELKAKLAKEGIDFKAYEAIFDELKGLPADAVVFYDPERFNRKLYLALPEAVKTISGTNITTEFKAIKNSVEEAKQREAYRIDALALTRFMYWLHQEIEVAKKEINEWEASERLLAFREQAESFIEPSFTTISAYGPNAAMMHYGPSPEKSAVIKPEGLYLFDSGGQYYEGTTDITRTQQMGPLTEEMKLAYTYTLKSSLTLLMGRFLAGATGSKLDAIARYPLWQIGSDYKCGTGHGVGFCLNVHEGPQRLGFAPNSVALKPGMVVTVEPGVYKEGKFGIRIENVVIVKEELNNDSGQFLKLDALNYIPMDTRPVLVEHLTDAEIEWVNAYQQRSYEELKEQLSPAEAEWLKDFCAPLSRV